MRHRLLFVLLIIFGISAYIGNIIYAHTIGATIQNREKEIIRQNNIGMVDLSENPKPGVINYLLLGVDEREEDNGRSDTIMIASINFLTHKIGLISIPRDTLAEIPLHGKQKINHAYAYGGVKLTKQVVEQETGIKINNYIIANFNAFKNIVNTFGGVEIDVEKDMYYRDDYDGPYGFTIDLKAGKQTLDGDHALQYVRFRDDEGDIGRAKRQQNFLKQFSKKFISRNIITDAPNLIRQITSSINTDISFNEMVRLLRNIDPKANYEVETILLSGHPEMIDDLSYWVIDKNLSHSQLVSMNDFVAHSEPMKEKTNGFDEKPQELLKESDLDWQIAQLDKEIKEHKDAREKLLKEAEEEERAKQQPIKIAEAATKSTENGITIINTTSDEEKTQTAIEALKNEDIEIGMVSAKGSGSPTEKTIFIVGTNDKETIQAIKAMPFKCTVLYRKNVSKPTLIIGNIF